MLLTLLRGPATPPTNTIVWLKVAGVWKQTTGFINVSGTWKTLTGFYNDNGTWK